MSDTTTPQDESLRFLRELHPDPGGNKILIWTLSRVTGAKLSHWCDTAEQAADVAQQHRDGHDVYVGMGLSQEAFGPHNRCKSDQVAAIAGLWLDADVKGPTHDTGAESVDVAREVAARFALAPTVVNGSGIGLQAFWLFKEPWLLDSETERRRAIILAARFGNTLEHFAKARGFSVKGTFDIARVMRVPGTLNQCKGKCDPRPSAILEMDPGRRYDPSDFDEFLSQEADDAAAGEAPVGVEQLHFDPAAEPPAEKFKALAKENALFALSWDNDRSDKPQWSQSEYDLSVAAYAAAAGWSQQEVCDLIIAHRRKHGADLKLGQKCYPLTVGRAFARVLRCEREKAEAVEKARSAVGRALRAAADQRAPSAVFGVVGDLANLPDGERADAYAKFKATIGPALNLRDLRAAVRSAGKAKRRKAGATHLPPIVIAGRHLRDVTLDSVRALAAANDPPELFVRCGQPSRMHVDENGIHTIAPTSEAALRGRLDRVANFLDVNKYGEEFPVAPPLEVVRDILALDLMPYCREHRLREFPPLDAVTETPVLRPDGTVLHRPGYDPATRLWYAPAPGLEVPPVPDNPTPKQVREAADLIEEAIGEFPYEGTADKGNAFGTMLTPYVRQAIGGKVPLALIDAPMMGTGKSLLAETLGTIVTGHAPAMMGAPDEDAEWRKQITATLLDGPTVIIIDNVAGTLSSPSLARALTAPVWSDRILGVSQQAKLPQLATWIATGNNIAVGGDMARRCYRVRLDAKTAQPWRRNGFRHPNLIQWVTENRGRLVAALLTLCRAWHAAGKPEGPGPVIGSFEAWSRTVGGILALAGIPGFLSNLDNLYDQSDEETGQWERFLSAWHERYGTDPVTVAVLLAGLLTDAGQPLRDALPDSLAGYVETDPSKFPGVPDRYHVRDVGKFKIRLGKLLKERAGRRYGAEGLHLVRGDDSHGKVATWAVKSAGSAGSQTGVAGSEKHDSPRDNGRDGSGLSEDAGSAGSDSTLGDEQSTFDAAAHSHERLRAQGNRASRTPATPRTPRNGNGIRSDDQDFDAAEREAMQMDGV